MGPSILIISGEAGIRDEVAGFSAASGVALELADAGTRGVERLQYGALPLAVLIDLALKGVPAQAVLRAVARRYPDLTVVMVGDTVSEAAATILLHLGASSVISRAQLASEIPHILESLARLPPALSPFRAHRRIAVQLPVEVQLEAEGAYETLQTRDLSLSGAFIPMSAPPPAGSRVKLRLRDATGDPTELCGEVTRCLATAGNTGMAVHFVDCTEAERDALASLLAQLGRPRSAKSAPRAENAEATEAPAFNLDDLLVDAQAFAAEVPSMSTLPESLAIPEENAESSPDVALGERLLRIGSSALAQKRFAKARTDDPHSARLQFLYALAGAREATRLKQHEQAVEHYLQVLALDPDCAEALDATRPADKRRLEKKGLLRKLFSGS